MMADASALNDLVICVPRLATLLVVHLTFGEECPQRGARLQGAANACRT